MGTLLGSEILAQSLKSQGVDTMFYIMGGPMLETEATCIKLGIRAIDTRHEQAAALSAEAWGRVMRASIAMNGPYFSSQRMLQQYMTNAYRLSVDTR